MTLQIDQLSKMQKTFGALFVLFFLFSLCICTPLFPVSLFESVIGEPIATVLAEPFDGTIHVLGIPLPRILASLFGLMSGCLAMAMTIIGFGVATVFKWRSEDKEIKQKYLEIEIARIELERQRLVLEKQRLSPEEDPLGERK